MEKLKNTESAQLDLRPGALHVTRQPLPKFPRLEILNSSYPRSPPSWHLKFSHHIRSLIQPVVGGGGGRIRPNYLPWAYIDPTLRQTFRIWWPKFCWNFSGLLADLNVSIYIQTVRAERMWSWKKMQLLLCPHFSTFGLKTVETIRAKDIKIFL